MPSQLAPLAAHFKSSKKDCSQLKEEKLEMSKIRYSAVSSLLYAMVCTRLDITRAISVVSRFFSNRVKAHWETVEWIMLYLLGTTKLCLQFGGYDPVLEGYTNSDMAGCLDDRKSTLGYVFTFARGAVL